MLAIRCVLLVICATACSQPAVADDAAEQAKREEKFAEALSGSVLVGTFSIDGVKAVKSPLPERYELKSVEKTKEGLWTFKARVSFLTKDVTLPITVPVVWAGDTPMVSLSNATLPGFGDQLSAKVIFDNDRYAGTWQHGKFGGHMWGRIERPGDEKPTPATAGANAPPTSE
jgi:hypothetical protein